MAGHGESGYRDTGVYLLACSWHWYSKPHPRALPWALAFLLFQTGALPAVSVSCAMPRRYILGSSPSFSLNGTLELLLSLSLGHKMFPCILGCPLKPFLALKSWLRWRGVER